MIEGLSFPKTILAKLQLTRPTIVTQMAPSHVTTTSGLAPSSDPASTDGSSSSRSSDQTPANFFSKLGHRSPLSDDIVDLSTSATTTTTTKRFKPSLAGCHARVCHAHDAASPAQRKISEDSFSTTHSGTTDATSPSLNGICSPMPHQAR